MERGIRFSFDKGHEFEVERVGDADVGLEGEDGGVVPGEDP